jgi:hypothetical protein
VFTGTFGTDFIGDFRQDEDKIEFNVDGVDDFSDLNIAQSGSDTIITMAH